MTITDYWQDSIYTTTRSVEEALAVWRDADLRFGEAKIAERDALFTTGYGDAADETNEQARLAANAARYLIATLLSELGVEVEPLAECPACARPRSSVEVCSACGHVEGLALD